MTPQERMAELHVRANELAGKLRSSEEDKEFNDILAEANTLEEQIQANTRFAQIEAFGKKSAGTPVFARNGAAIDFEKEDSGATVIETKKDTFGRSHMMLSDEWGAGTVDSAKAKVLRSAEYRQEWNEYIRTGARRGAGAYRTLQEGVDPSGGFLVTPEFLEKVISREPTPTRVRGFVTNLTTDRDTLIMPKVIYNSDDIYTTGMRVTWTGEVPSSSTAARVTEPVFGRATIPVYTAMMSIPLTHDLIEDSGFDVMSYVAAKFGETIEILYDDKILNGSGQGQPSGLLMNPGDSGNTQPAAVNAGNPYTADGLLGVAYSLPEQYDMNARWVLKKTTTAAAIAKLKDSNNRYIWGYGLQDSGMSVDIHNRTIAGYPVTFSQLMPDPAINAYPALFGDFSGYYLVNRVGFSIQVLRELYAETNTIVLVGRLRFGGQVVENWKLKAVKQA